MFRRTEINNFANTVVSTCVVCVVSIMVLYSARYEFAGRCLLAVTGKLGVRWG